MLMNPKGIPTITEDLHATPIATTLTAALFVLFLGIAPVFWASLSDYYRVRRFPTVLSMLIFSGASLGSAFVNNIWALVVLRCVQSVGSSCGQAVGAGAIAVSIIFLFLITSSKPAIGLLPTRATWCCIR